MPNGYRRRIALLVGLAVLAALAAMIVYALFLPFLAPLAPGSGAPSSTAARVAPRAGERRARPGADPETAPAAADAPSPSGPGDEPSAEPLNITVLRSDGTPAAGATVLLLDPNADDDQPNEIARTLADANGVASARAGDGVFRIAAWLGAEAGATSRLLDRSRRDVAIRLGSGFVAKGRVVRGDSPEAGADVELLVQPWFDSSFGHVLRTKSDADGRYEFPPVARAGVDALNPPYVEARARDRARGFAEVDMARPELELVVRLTPGFAVRGRFLDADGRPVAAEVWAVGARTVRTETDADGRVDLRLSDGRFRLVAKRPTGRSVLAEYVSDFDVEVATPAFIADPLVEQWCVARDLGTHADGAGDADLGEVLLVAGRPLKGQVVDAGGVPSPRAAVQLFLGDVRIGRVVCDAGGRFELPEVGGDAHRLDVREAEGLSRRGALSPVRGGDADVRVVLAPAFRVMMTFLADGDRTPVRASDVHAEAFRHGTHVTAARAHVVGDPMDSIALDVRAAGSYDVDVSVAGWEPVKFDAVEIVADRPVELDVLLRRKRD